MSLAVALAGGGCATVAPKPSAPDLLNVSAVAPPINAVANKTKDKAIRPTAAREPQPTGDSRAAATTPPTIPQSAPAYPIDLDAALRLADAQNPTIGEARVMILDALARRTAARALLLPYLNAGTNYHDHTGPLQRASGTILPLTEQSLYFGGGARSVAAETVAIPAVNIFSPLTEAIFEPLAANQRLVGARFDASSTANEVLLDVAGLYFDLIGAEAEWESRRMSAVEADRIATTVANFAATGHGRVADANRAEADRRLFEADIQKAEERVAVASALLAQRLSLDPSAQLKPVAGPIEPIVLIDPDVPVDDLIRAAVARRPDLASRDAIVEAAEIQVHKEKARPFLPTIWFGYSGGAFGGGSNIVTPTLGNFGGRTDLDARAYWTVLNLGAGNSSLIKQRRAQEGQAIADRARTLNRVREEVTSARSRSLALRQEVEIARRGLRTAEVGYNEELPLLRETLGKPIEALDSLRLLADARISLIEAITRANRTQFALFVSLGAPPPLGPR